MTAHPSSLSAETAESRRDAAEARREAFLPTREAALEDLVDKLMDGEDYPHRGIGPQIDLLDILCEIDQYDLAEAVCRELRDGPTLSLDIPKLVRAYLEGDGRAWVDMRMQDMAAEAEEESGV